MDELTFYKTLLDDMFAGVYFVDRDRQITYWNKGAERITGFGRDEVIGHSCRDNILNHVDENGQILCQTSCPLAKTIEDGAIREAEVYLRHKDGHRAPVRLRAMPIRDEGDAIIGAVEVFEDNSRTVATRKRIHDLEAMALADPLTGLPNRRYLEGIIQSKLSELVRVGLSFGVLFVDIDHFKLVNDRFGHDTGDQVLRMAAQTMRLSARPYDVIGRWGGEEFVGVIGDVDRDGLIKAAERLRGLVRESTIFREPEPIRVTISIGAAMGRIDDTVESLVKRTDTGVYLSKAQGRDRVTLQE